MSAKLKPLDADKLGPVAHAMFCFLGKWVIGQERGLKAITRVIERRHSPFRTKNKPIGSFLFLGPSRVGKTETARVLAQYLFGDRTYLTHVDCTLFNSPHEVAKLKGSPPGYVGFKEAGADSGSPYPFFSHWNLYKYHHWYLAGLYQDETLEVQKRNQEMEDLKKELRRLFDEARHNRDELKIAIGQKAANQDPKGNEKEIEELDKKIKQLRVITKQLIERWIKLQCEINEAQAALKPIVEDGCQTGWIYNCAQPPDNLEAIVLFDEIEKSDEALHDHIMEIVDTGRCQLDNGEITPFQNAVIIMTSNVAQVEISRVLNENSIIGFHKAGPVLSEKELDQRIYDIAMVAAKREFRPEFLNRIDEIIVYRPLSRDSMLKILDIRIDELLAGLRSENLRLRLKFDPSVKEYLANRAMKSTEQGAGLLEKQLNKYVRDRLVNLVNTAQIKTGDTVVIKMDGEDGGEFAFYKEEK